MFIVASIGFLGNIISVFLLHKDSEHNLNVRAAYLHLIGDTLSSVGVIIGSVLIYFWEITWIDPLLTVIIGIVIIKATWGIVKETVEILMQSSPEGLDLKLIKVELEKHPRASRLDSCSLGNEFFHFRNGTDLLWIRIASR